MKKTFLILGFAVAAFSVAALDNTDVNDFWDTTGYVNGTVSSQSAILATTVDPRLKVVRETAALEMFSTYNGMLVTIR